MGRDEFGQDGNGKVLANLNYFTWNVLDYNEDFLPVTNMSNGYFVRDKYYILKNTYNKNFVNFDSPASETEFGENNVFQVVI